MLGYAHALSPHFTVRGDYGTGGSYEMNETEDGLDLSGQATYNRAGLFGDWFPFAGGFRITGGVTFNNMKADLNAQGNGTEMSVGDATFISDAELADVRADVEKIRAIPMIAIGFNYRF
jgi:hypothetical protein